jgi:hypothetical protein
MVNSTWEDGPNGAEIVVKRYVNLGIAAATERGLIVPKVKDAQDLDLPGLARALNELATKARAGKASPADLSDGTISITNVGVFGVDTGTPILTPGEAAILAFGQIRDMPWVHEGELAIRKVTTLALSFDHRIVDGELGSRVLRDVGDLLVDPTRLRAWSYRLTVGPPPGRPHGDLSARRVVAVVHALVPPGAGARSALPTGHHQHLQHERHPTDDDEDDSDDVDVHGIRHRVRLDGELEDQPDRDQENTDAETHCHDLRRTIQCRALYLSARLVRHTSRHL